MSAEDVERVREGYEIFNRGDVEEILERLDPGVELHVSDAYFDAPHIYRGHEGFRQFFATQAEVFDEFRIEPERILDAGDRVLAIVRAGGRGKGSGAEVSGRFGHLWTMEGEKALRMVEFKDPEEALRQAGLSG